MTGRNNRPDKDGKAGKPARLDQFGDQLAKNDIYKPNQQACDKNS